MVFFRSIFVIQGANVWEMNTFASTSFMCVCVSIRVSAYTVLFRVDLWKT